MELIGDPEKNIICTRVVAKETWLEKTEKRLWSEEVDMLSIDKRLWSEEVDTLSIDNSF